MRRLLTLLPLITVTAVPQDEPRQHFWHVSHPYRDFRLLWDCKTKEKRDRDSDFGSYIEKFVKENTKEADELLEGYPVQYNERFVLEMVLLKEEEKYRVWEPLWIIRKPFHRPQISKVRMFINEPENSIIEQMCRNHSNPHFDFEFNIPIHYKKWMYKPYLICNLDSPPCSHTVQAFYCLFIIFFPSVIIIIYCHFRTQDSATDSQKTASDDLGAYYQQWTSDRPGRAERRAMAEAQEDALNPEVQNPFPVFADEREIGGMVLNRNMRVVWV